MYFYLFQGDDLCASSQLARAKIWQKTITELSDTQVMGLYYYYYYMYIKMPALFQFICHNKPDSSQNITDTTITVVSVRLICNINKTVYKLMGLFS